MSVSLALLAVALGLLTGFINTLAGSGSLLTLPFLIFAGLPADIANGTNRIGVFLQTLTGTATLQARTRIPLRGSGVMIGSSTLGSAVGALLARGLDADTMHLVIGILMVALIVPVTLKPSQWLREVDDPHPGSRRRQALEAAVFFLLGIYGGFIQAGVGIFMMAAMVYVSRFSLARANLLKNLIVCIFTIPALAIFIWDGKVDWTIGLTLASGQMAGAWVAARFMARSKAAGEVTRWLVVLMLLGGAVKMFWVG